MIEFSNTGVYNFDGALRGLRNPLNSWDKSDSIFCPGSCDLCDKWRLDGSICSGNMIEGDFVIGENDLNLAKKLIKAGSDHRKFLRQIIVSVDILAPRYWWTEFDTYKVGTVANSCSTMHTIHKKEFEIDDFSHDKLKRTLMLQLTITTLNLLRESYLETNEKDYWYEIIQLLPQSYNQLRTVTLNYEVLRNMYHARKNHKLDEWSIGFVEWIKSLPYSEFITEE